ncbi:hypothetical protein BABINDRAFT_159376 [Babjeviella inositovora NRRL Y-12698]|uniref:Protein BTN n=1 Tax=Babjeviella inositovora NRRL Y-12698 TaxID=984486 RepID=A0A1E3QZ29_9ASCO|nr:uncharacterized protein BABINDRAFT_159376 [Babjeviella inositovora NRRL Y-12698]ODQ82881.1 hypothetical protein BABINDRAFT_159376 [Babjeviella inositovora NRRL Y-12698]
MVLTTTDKRVFGAFWLFGLVNNVLYVVILSAAIDLVGVFVPKATVLLADVLPSFIVKCLAPFVIHLVPYNYRIFMLIGLSFTGMLTISFSASTSWKLFGIVLASISSGVGELTFLQLTHYYSEMSLEGFSSGTGGAGLAGSFLYLLLTTWLTLSVRTSLLLFSLAPFSFLASYFWLLPHMEQGFHPIDQSELPGEDSNVVSGYHDSGILGTDFGYRAPQLLANKVQEAFGLILSHSQSTLIRAKPLIVPFMAPLFTVYISEYIINQGVTPTLLFPIAEMPMFTKYRDAYVTYGTLYQLGVFISRSSSSFVRIRRLYIPSLLQFLNLVICLFQSLFMFIPNVYILMVLMFYEGLLGGAAYVNTFKLVSETVSLEDREFAMGTVGVSDSAGIVLAACFSMWLEPSLCGYQVGKGRDWCQLP